MAVPAVLPDTVLITFAVGAGGGGTVGPPEEYAFPVQFTIQPDDPNLIETPDADYLFSKWSTQADGSDTFTLPWDVPIGRDPFYSVRHIYS